MLDNHAQSFPLSERHDAMVARPANTTNNTITNRRLLIVEDEPAIRDALHVMLEDGGYTVLCSDNGEQALALLSACVPLPDVIMLDLMMPVMDGWEFRLRQRSHPRLARIPVLVMSSDGSAKAAAIDADGFLPKPFRDSDLKRALEGVERKQEQAEHGQALMAMGTMVASVAHELKNPLTYVLGNMELATRAATEMGSHVQNLRASAAPGPTTALCESLLTDLVDLEKAADEARAGLDRIVALTRDLGDLSRKPEPRRERFALKTALESAIRMTAHRIAGQAALSREYLAAAAVVGDCARLTQVFVNLLVNAGQAVSAVTSRPRQVRVRLRAASGSAVVDVEDTGEGLPPDLARQVFEPFFSTKPAGEGSGLGLAISREIVAAHGGTIEFVSWPGQGSRVRVILPLAPPGEDQLTTIGSGASASSILPKRSS
jgi:signal transduction histidine kinase